MDSCRKYTSYLNLKLQIVREGPPLKVIQVRSAEDIVNQFHKEYMGFPNEVFKCVHLNSKNYIIGVETISTGTLTCSLVNAREALKGAVINNTASVIFMHQHPSGDPSPSQNDIGITNNLLAACNLFNIKMLDHIIFGNEPGTLFYSFLDEGFLKSDDSNVIDRNCKNFKTCVNELNRNTQR